MKYKITPIKEQFFPEILELIKELANYEGLPDKMINTLDQMNSEKELIRGFVATNETGKIIGYSTNFFAYYTWVGKSLYMDDLYVQEKYRGMGIGTHLIQANISFAKQNNCKRLRWQVSEWNKSAIEFYKNLGARVDGTESNCDMSF